MERHDRYAVNRLMTYMMLIGAENDDPDERGGKTIRSIADLCRLPAELVRRDIAAMITEELIIPADTDMPAREDLLEDIEAGQADDLAWMSFHDSALYRIPLTADEYEAYRLLDETYDDRVGSILYIKDSFRSAGYENLLEHLSLITDAITRQADIRLQMQNGDRPDSKIQICPVKIVYDALDNAYAVAAVEDGKLALYRLDRIRNIEVIKGGHERPDDIDALTDPLHRLWGLDRMDGPYHARVRFYDEAHVHDKVRRDTANRKYAKLTERDGFLYFEDEIYGYEAFKAWVCGFGASAVVESPERLRDEIVSAMKTAVLHQEQ